MEVPHMHWVDRGPEPIRLGPIRERQTPRWIKCYRDGEGDPPTNRAWRLFRDDIMLVFHGLCAYCEQRTQGEVDHFHPKSLFPEEVYFWSNWLFSCHACNQAKGENWPPEGYVDPCAPCAAGHPEYYFDFSLRLGRIIPRAELSCEEKSKALSMIKDLKLNEWFQVQDRKRSRIRVLDRLAGPSLPGALGIVQDLAKRHEPLSSVTRAWLIGRGFSV